MFDKLIALEHQYEDLVKMLGSAEVQSDPSEYRKHAKTLAEIEPTVEKFREYQSVARRAHQRAQGPAGPQRPQ